MRRDKPEEERRTEIIFCYTCGHSDGSHEQYFNLKGGEMILGRCILPVSHKNSALGFKWIDVCKCKLFITKEMVRQVQLPEK